MYKRRQMTLSTSCALFWIVDTPEAGRASQTLLRRLRRQSPTGERARLAPTSGHFLGSLDLDDSLYLQSPATQAQYQLPLSRDRGNATGLLP